MCVTGRVNPKDHFMILRNCWHFWCLGFWINFFLKKGQSLQTARTLLFCSCLLHSEDDGVFLGCGETVGEICVIRVGETPLLNSHLAKLNSGAEHPGSHFNPYRGHILGVGLFLILFFVGSAVFQFPLFAPRRRGHGGIVQWQAVARVKIPNVLLYKTGIV